MENKCKEILEIEHVTNRYRDSGAGFFSKDKMTRVLNDVSLTIHRDEIFGEAGVDLKHVKWDFNAGYAYHWGKATLSSGKGCAGHDPL